ncbi:MAG TPA: hypothetical protein VMU83_21820 [Hanamia sp.]|nr:hypothetical protein [Hanamia sp.]
MVVKYLSPGVLFPDGLQLREVDVKQFLSLLLTTAGALLGILVAALLLSFQLVGKEAKRRKESNVLHNKWVVSFAGLSLFLITALTISYIIIPSFAADNDLSIGYYLLYAFFAFLLLLFYIVYILLRDTNTLDKARKTIASLDVNDFVNVIQTYYRGNWMNANQLKLSEIRDEVLYAIRDNDNGALHALLTELTARANELITAEITREDCEAIVESVTIIWKDAEASAAGNGRSAFYEIVSNSVETFYYHAATKKIQLLYYHDLRNYYNNLAEHLAGKGDLMSLRKVINVLEKSFGTNLKQNCPTENNLQHLLKNYHQPGGTYSTDAEIQWEDIGDFIYDISKIQELAIDHKFKDLYIAAHRSLHLIAAYIEHNDFPDLGKFQRAYLLTKIIALRLLLSGESAMTEDLFEDTLNTYRLDATLVADMIVKDAPAAKKILTSIGDFLMKARRKGKLNAWWTINEFGAVPRHTTKHYLANQTVQQATKYFFEVFKKMKEEIEAGELVKEAKTYEEIKKQLEALSSSLTDDVQNGATLPLVAEIQQCLGTFQQVDAAADFNIVPWPIKEEQ